MKYLILEKININYNDLDIMTKTLPIKKLITCKEKSKLGSMPHLIERGRFVGRFYLLVEDFIRLSPVIFTFILRGFPH